MLQEHQRLLSDLARKYQVQPRFLVALWGIESNYGNNTGKVPILSALATLAYDARRSEFFRGELLTALKILDAGQLTKEQMFGSWAGAMGQLQFMPSTFLRYAVDGNADGRIDLWNTKEDYLASAANYLHQAGWQAGQTWGRVVDAPASLKRSQLGLEHQKPLSRWQALGVRLPNGQSLPDADRSASLLIPDESVDQAFLVYTNYRVLMKWNRAHSFALSVGMLADRIAGAGE